MINKRNRLQCSLCNDILESEFTHDFKNCSCGNMYIDGGSSYRRCGAADLSTILIVNDDDTVERLIE